MERRIFGKTWTSPVYFSPVGVLDLARPDGDRLLAKAASESGVPLVFSNQASVSMEDCSAVMEANATRWFQLYWSRSDELVCSFLSRAEACGCQALVLTLDTTLLGFRPRDLNLGYLPFLEGRGIAQYVRDPVFRRLMETPIVEEPTKSPLTWQALRTLVAMNRRFPGKGLISNISAGLGRKAVRTFTRIYSRPDISWDQLSWLREQTRLPLILKGILHPDDAEKALDHGVDGLIVSNHGGRQLDGAVASLEALPGIADRVRGRVPVFLDSGIRSGADVFKALALGATAVGIGRPYVYALALQGTAGVTQYMEALRAELEITMLLSGCNSVEELDKGFLCRK